MTRTRSQIGRDNQQLGENLESWLNEQHSLAAEKGILAHVEKTQARSKIVHGKLIFEKPGVADYIGCLEGVVPPFGITRSFPRGAAGYLAVEAKSVEDVRLPKSRVEPKQQEHLTAVALAGGLSLLVVEFRTVGVVTGRQEAMRYAVPWLEVPWVTLRTAESVLEKDIAQWLVQPGTCYLSRWHAGGLRSGAHSVGSQRHKVYPRE